MDRVTLLESERATAVAGFQEPNSFSTYLSGTAFLFTTSGESPLEMLFRSEQHRCYSVVARALKPF